MKPIRRYKKRTRKAKVHNTDLQQQTGQDQQSPEHILLMQQTMGNQAVARMVASGALRPKLTMGKPGDALEQEADNTADKVMNMTAGPVQGQTDGGNVQRQSDEEEETVQGKGATSSGISKSVSSQIQGIKNSGQPLSASVRAFFEPRFGIDFSNVKIHNDEVAHKTSSAINAKAYTLGNHIAFAKGEYKPDSREGKHLMAHELTHIVQQRNSNGPQLKKEENSIQRADAKTKEIKCLQDLKGKYEHSVDISKAEIRMTNEYKAYMDDALIWKKKYKVTDKMAIFACQMMFEEMKSRPVNWKMEAKRFLVDAKTILGPFDLSSDLDDMKLYTDDLRRINNLFKKSKSESDFARKLNSIKKSLKSNKATNITQKILGMLGKPKGGFGVKLQLDLKVDWSNPSDQSFYKMWKGALD